MKPEKVESRWKCRDGSEHKTEESAARHQKMLEALADFDEAKAKLAHAMVKTYKTKDGKPFNLGSMHEYFFVIDYFGIPAIRKISFWGWYNQKFYLQQDGRLDVIETVGVDQSKSFCVAEIYASEAMAKEEVNQKKQQLIERLKGEIA